MDYNVARNRIGFCWNVSGQMEEIQMDNVGHLRLLPHFDTRLYFYSQTQVDVLNKTILSNCAHTVTPQCNGPKFNENPL